MQPTVALRMLQATPRMAFRASPSTAFRASARMMRPVPAEDQAGHTVSQRLRKLKQVPPELWPLAVVVGFALFAAGYSCTRKFLVDKNLRLARQGAAARAENH